MMFTSRIRSSALFMTVIITVIIGMVCFLFLLLTYHSRNDEIRTRITKKLDLNLTSGVQVLLADTNSALSSRSDTIDLFGGGEDSINVRRDYWGVYNIGVVHAVSGSWRKKRAFVYGASLPKSMRTCLYLADHKRPLYVSGNTILKGNAYLPSSGIKATYLDQRAYSSEKLIDGKVRKSETQLPGLNVSRLEYLTGLLTKAKAENFLSLLPDSVSVEMESEVQMYSLRSYGVISNKKLVGKVALLSDSLIEVDSNSTLDQVLIIAPIVKIKKRFTGSVQVIASKEIIVEDDCQLTYPSSLALVTYANLPDPVYIKIGSNSHVQGVVFAGGVTRAENRIFYHANEGSVVDGVLYINGFAEIRGKVFGSVVADYFIRKVNANTLENYLVDAELNYTGLLAGFVGSDLFLGSIENKVIKWNF